MHANKVKWKDGGLFNGVEVVEILSDSDKEEEPKTYLRKRKSDVVPLAPLFTPPYKRRKSEELPTQNPTQPKDATKPIEEEKSPHVRGRSYYLTNFTLILDVVLERHSHLLSDEEAALLLTFRHTMSERAQRLYIRLFQRKGPYFRTHCLDYPEIEDLAAAMKVQHARYRKIHSKFRQELNQNGFCQGLRHLGNEDLCPELLGTLTVAQLKVICRAARSQTRTPAAKRNSQREELIAEIKDYAQRRSVQRTLDGRSMVASLVEKALKGGD